MNHQGMLVKSAIVMKGLKENESSKLTSEEGGEIKQKSKKKVVENVAPATFKMTQ